MRRVALGLPAADERRLDGLLRRHGHDVVARCASASELIGALATLDAAMVMGAPGYLTAELLAEADARGVRIIALARSDADRRYAASLGIHEVADADADWPALEPLLHALAAAPVEPGRGSAIAGSVIAVWGPGGAPGRTAVATGIAAELAATGATVVLADADTYSGSIAPVLGLLDEAPGFAAACRLAGASSLNRAELERIGQRYLSPRGAFWVLTGIGRPGRWPELAADRVTATLRECRSWVDYTVVDTGFSLENDEEISSDLLAPRRNAATVSALREADRVVAVGSADPVGLSRFLRAHVDLVELLGSDELTVVMNRVRPGAIGPGPATQVRQTLQRFGGIVAPVMVPHDQQAFDAALLEGRTLLDTAPKSPARVALRDLVAQRMLGATGTGGSRFAPVPTG